MMRKRLLYLFGYLLFATISLFMVILNIATLIGATFETTREQIQVIVFTVVLGIIFLISLFFFVIWLLRILKDTKINKENK